MGQCGSDADCAVNEEYGGGLECVAANETMRTCILNVENLVEGVDCVTADATFATEHHLKPESKVCMWKKWHNTDTRAKCRGKHVWYGDHLGQHCGGCGRKSNAKWSECYFK